MALSRFYISDHVHGASDLVNLKLFPVNRKLISKSPIIIEDNLWIGEGAVILPRVTVGENSVVGVNVVVTKDAPLFLESRVACRLKL